MIFCVQFAHFTCGPCHYDLLCLEYLYQRLTYFKKNIFFINCTNLKYNIFIIIIVCLYLCLFQWFILYMILHNKLCHNYLILLLLNISWIVYVYVQIYQNHAQYMYWKLLAGIFNTYIIHDLWTLHVIN